MSEGGARVEGLRPIFFGGERLARRTWAKNMKTRPSSGQGHTVFDEQVEERCVGQEVLVVAEASHAGLLVIGMHPVGGRV